MRGYTWVPHFHSIAVALKKANLINLPFCRGANLAYSFVFCTSFMLGLNYCFSYFQRIYNVKNLKKIKVDMEKNICVSFAIMPKKLIYCPKKLIYPNAARSS